MEKSRELLNSSINSFPFKALTPIKITKDEYDDSQESTYKTSVRSMEEIQRDVILFEKADAKENEDKIIIVPITRQKEIKPIQKTDPKSKDNQHILI